MNNALHQRWQSGEVPFDGCTMRFDTDELTPLPALHRALLAVVPALQERWSQAQLFTLDDWHEHDGYVNAEQPTNWQELWQRVGNNETTMAFTCGSMFQQNTIMTILKVAEVLT